MRDEITAIAKRLAQKHPDAPAQTLARRLVREANNAITLKAARMRIQRQFGCHGQKNRQRQRPSAPRAPRVSGEVRKMPASRVEPWGPYVLDVVGRVGILSDVHVPYHSEIAVRAAVSDLLAAGIDALVLNGDICDFYAISRYMKDPRKRNFSSELKACREFLAWIREQFPAIPIVMKSGNHEERYLAWLWQHAAELADEPMMGLGQWLGLAEQRIDLVEDKRPIMAGRLPILHGHEKGNGISAPVNQARGAFLRLHHTVLEGHGHRTSAHSEPDMFGSEVFCWSTGCLSDLRPEYARFNKFNWGFATVDVHADGSFDVMNKRITAEGKVRQS